MFCFASPPTAAEYGSVWQVTSLSTLRDYSLMGCSTLILSPRCWWIDESWTFSVAQGVFFGVISRKTQLSRWSNWERRLDSHLAGSSETPASSIRTCCSETCSSKLLGGKGEIIGRWYEWRRRNWHSYWITLWPSDEGIFTKFDILALMWDVT